jgi:hypothetical protein
MDFDSMMFGSGVGFEGGSLTLNSHVTANSVPLQFDISSMTYRGFGTLIYDSLTGTFLPPPPAFDCGTTFSGNPGTIDVTGEFDLNVNPLAISDPSEIVINLTVNPNVTEQIFFLVAGPGTPCGGGPIQTEFYNLFWIFTREQSLGSPFIPVPVNINIPTFLNASASLSSGGLTLSANGTTTITLTSQ